MWIKLRRPWFGPEAIRYRKGVVEIDDKYKDVLPPTAEIVTLKKILFQKKRMIPFKHMTQEEKLLKLSKTLEIKRKQNETRI
jgi:hypothetical protein